MKPVPSLPSDGRRWKATHLSSVHPLDDVRIQPKECKALVDAGFEVSLVIPTSSDQVLDGVKIRSVPVPRSRRERLGATIWKVYRAALAERADVYHFHDPELIPIGVLLKLRGAKVIYDVHEDVPRQILDKQWLPARTRRAISLMTALLERFVARMLDGIVTATPSIGKRFPPKKTVAVQNFPRLSEFGPTEGALAYSERASTVLYVGRVSDVSGTRELIQGMNRVSRRDARLTIAGICRPASLEAELRASPGWTRVDFLGWKERQAVALLMGRSRVGVVTYLPLPNHLEAQPTKLFEYMAAGLPVIASDFAWWRELLAPVGCSLFVDPQDPDAIANAIDWVLSNPTEAEAMGRRGQAAVRERLNWEAQARLLAAFYERLFADL
jgi:glycosyltransferase involved in cell wall biosynthesis